jgi:hypothetical protein
VPAHDELTLKSGVRDLARAIANAEGWGLPGTIPTRANNPGDLVLPNWNGPVLGAERIAVFSSEQEGWLRLYHQLQLIASGRSKVYTLGMTIREMGARWTATQPNEWALNVAAWLATRGYVGTSPETLLGSLLQ